MHSPWHSIGHSQNGHWEKHLHNSPSKIWAHSSPCSLLHWWMGVRPRTELFMCCYPSPDLIQALGSAVKFSSLWGPFTTTTANQPSQNKKQLSSRSHAGQKFSSRVRLCTAIFTSPRTSTIYRITKSLRLERALRSQSPTNSSTTLLIIKPWPRAPHPHAFTLPGMGLHHIPGQHLPMLDSWRNYP